MVVDLDCCLGSPVMLSLCPPPGKAAVGAPTGPSFWVFTGVVVVAELLAVLSSAVVVVTATAFTKLPPTADSSGRTL